MFWVRNWLLQMSSGSVFIALGPDTVNELSVTHGYMKHIHVTVKCGIWNLLNGHQATHNQTPIRQSWVLEILLWRQHWIDLAWPGLLIFFSLIWPIWLWWFSWPGLVCCPAHGHCCYSIWYVPFHYLILMFVPLVFLLLPGLVHRMCEV